MPFHKNAAASDAIFAYIDFDEIDRLALQHLEVIVRHFVDQKAETRNGEVWFDDQTVHTRGNRDSASISLQSGKWNCRASGKGGHGLISLIAEQCFQGSRKEAAHAINGEFVFGVGTSRRPTANSARSSHGPSAQEAPPQPDNDDKPKPQRSKPACEDKIDKARSVWEGRASIASTPSESYLRVRGIDPQVLSQNECGHLKRQYVGKDHYRSALVLPVTDGVTRKLTAIQRIYSEADGSPTPNPKTRIGGLKKVLGKFEHSGIWLGAPTKTIVMVEGPIDAISVRMACPQFCAVSTISAGHMGKQSLPQGVGRIIVIPDDNPAGEAAIRRAKRNWGDTHDVLVARLPEGKDSNDVLRECGAGELAELIAKAEPYELDQEKDTALSLAATADFSDEGDRQRFLDCLHRECAVLTSSNTVRYTHEEIVGDVVPVGHQQLPMRRRNISRYMKRDFQAKFETAHYMGLTTSGKEKRLYLTDEWTDNQRRRTYTGERFLPGGETPTNILNLWGGWGVDPAPGDWSLLDEHIFRNLCDGNIPHTEWVLGWMADLFQNPARKPGTALVFRGEKGTGKTKLAEWLMYLVGQHAMICDNAEQISGRFNGHLADKLLLIADEATWGGRRSMDGKLKSLITNHNLPIERKGIDIVELPSYHRLIITANDKWAVPATADERRYAVFDVGNGRRQDRAFFKELDEQMINGGAAAMMHDLMSRSISIDVGDAPKTKGLGGQVAAGLDEIQATIVNVAAEGEARHGITSIPLSDNSATTISATTFRQIIEERSRYTPSPSAVGSALRAVGIKRVRSGRQADGKRPWLYHIPPLDDLVANIEREYGHSLGVLIGEE